MEVVQSAFEQVGMTDLNLHIVNSRDLLSQYLGHHLERFVTFPVHQDTDDDRIWEKMKGGKDDMYIFDRCGRLAFYIPYPISNFSDPINLVPTLLKRTYNGEPCGPCFNMFEDDENMVPDESHEHHNLTSVHEKNPDDETEREDEPWNPNQLETTTTPSNEDSTRMIYNKHHHHKHHHHPTEETIERNEATTENFQDPWEVQTTEVSPTTENPDNSECSEVCIGWTPKRVTRLKECCHSFGENDKHDDKEINRSTKMIRCAYLKRRCNNLTPILKCCPSEEDLEILGLSKE